MHPGNTAYWSIFMRLLLVFSLAFLLFIPPDKLLAMQLLGDKTIEIDGYGLTREEALHLAKRNGIEAAIGVVLSSPAEVDQFKQLKNKIITKSIGAVSKYSILKEEKQGDGWYVRIRALVSLDALTSELKDQKILLDSMTKPRTMVLIQEKFCQSAENSIVNYLQGQGFDMIDPARAAALRAQEDPLLRKAIKGDPVAATRLGVENGAELIVVGRVGKSLVKHNFLDESGMKSGKADLTATVINCSNGKIVAQKSVTGNAVHVSKVTAQANAAINAATNLMDKTLVEEIVSSFQDTIKNGASYDVSIAGVKSDSIEEKTFKLLTDTEGVVSVTKKNIGGNKLELSVLFKGSIDTLCDRVDSKPVEDTNLMVTNIVGSRVVLHLQ
jgi:hypothetical protein